MTIYTETEKVLVDISRSEYWSKLCQWHETDKTHVGLNRVEDTKQLVESRLVRKFRLLLKKISSGFEKILTHNAEVILDGFNKTDKSNLF